MLVLSPRAVERLETYKPAWPLPKIFRMTKGGKFMAEVFEGETINTPSMLALEDYIDALNWADTVGGAKGLMARADANAKTLNDWVDKTSWIANLAIDAKTRSNTSVCLKFTDPVIAKLPVEAQATFAKAVASLLDKENAAKDIAFYRDAPPGLRIWTGSTIEQADVTALLPWLEWAFAVEKSKIA
jgi:phosphoserine aminotransferase